MKTFGILAAAALLMPAAALADAITSPGAAFVSVPLTFQSTTGSNGGLEVPFWNNNSLDGLNMNGGYFLTGSNPIKGMTTDYLSSTGGFGDYLSTGGAAPDAPADFSFLQSGLTDQITLLYSNGGANMTTTYGTQIGFYNVADPSQKVILFDHGTLYNPAAGSGGVYNNNLSPESPFSVSTFADYGIFANTCRYTSNGSIACSTFYSDTALNPDEGLMHQHFAIFENPQDPQTYFVAFKDIFGLNSTEGYGDFNDAIFEIQTTTSPIHTVLTTPEPATFSIIGLGLLGLGLLRRRRAQKTA